MQSGSEVFINAAGTTSNVIDMSEMFYGAHAFNGWDTSWCLPQRSSAPAMSANRPSPK